MQPADEAASREAACRRERKFRCHCLRNLRRQCVKGIASAQNLAYFSSGQLDRDLNDATLAHGFGRLHFSSGTRDLRPPALEDTVLDRLANRERAE